MVSSISSSTSISQLFTMLDTKSQGYLEKSDLVSAFSKINGDNSTSSADEVFQALDSNSDGKVTESEFSSTLAKLQEELDSQFNQMRMQGQGNQGPQGMGGMPPPPPPKDDAGFTQEELTSQLEEIGSSDSERSNFISNIVQNFSAADTNGDGKVSFSEAQAYNSQSSSTSSDSTSSSTNTTVSTNTDAQVMFKIMQLMHAYGSFSDNSSQSSLSSLLSVSA
jgi:Ca2+-binding EF-hand superfamily protein